MEFVTHSFHRCEWDLGEAWPGSFSTLKFLPWGVFSIAHREEV